MNKFKKYIQKNKNFLIFILKTLKSIFVDEKFLTSKDKWCKIFPEIGGEENK